MYWGQHFCSCCSFWNCSQWLISTSYILSGIASEREHNMAEFLGRELHSLNCFNSGDCIRCNSSLMKCSQPRLRNISSRSWCLISLSRALNCRYRHGWMDLSAVAVEMKKLTNGFYNHLFYFLYWYFMEDNDCIISLVCVCVCLCVCVCVCVYKPMNNMWVCVYVHVFIPT